MQASATRTRLLLLLCLLALPSACAGGFTLMPTPDLYAADASYPAEKVPEAFRKSRVRLLYLTDRAPIARESGAIAYGAKRSLSLAFGTVVVGIGDGLSWPSLVASSEGSRRKRSIPVKVLDRSELERFPPTPFPFEIDHDRIVESPAIVRAQDAAAKQFRAVLQEELSGASRKEVVIFVHGFNDSFDYAAQELAEMWHFLGRMGVPLLYSWPAAHGGLFGYFVDRESGEFTIFHFKQMIRLLASFPEVERIHIIAHSRGTDVATTALRELIIACRAAGRNPREALRIENLILAAPDLDFDIVRQRLMAEKFGPAFGQINIYTTQADRALELSETLMSGTRFGHIRTSNLDATDAAIFEAVKNVHIISVRKAGIRGFVGHDYFLTQPGASSDIILTLRKHLQPGDPGRPLVHQHDNFWVIPPGYPQPVAPEP